MEELKRDLENREMSFVDLDNYMMEHGFYSVFNDGATDNIKECGNVVYTGLESKEAEVIIYFTITIDSAEDEAEEHFYVLINEIDEF